jgi:hypothetical protein
MRHVGGEKTCVTWTKLVALAADLRNGAPLDDVTNLVDVRMAVRKRAM